MKRCDFLRGLRPEVTVIIGSDTLLDPFHGRSLRTLLDLLSWLTAEDFVVDLIALSFDVQNEWSGLSLDVAHQVVIVSQFQLW